MNRGSTGLEPRGCQTSTNVSQFGENFGFHPFPIGDFLRLFVALLWSFHLLPIVVDAGVQVCYLIMTTAKLSASAPMEAKKSPAVDQSLLDLFWELAEINQPRQTTAASKLVEILVNTEPPNGEKDQLSRSVDYCYKRLMRGLASNRKGARWGYGAALSVLLQQYPSITTARILQDMDEMLKINGPQDLKSAGVGRMTLFMILINSGRLNGISLSSLRILLDALAQLEGEKSYLKNGSQEIFKQLMQRLPSDQFERQLFPQIKDRLSKPLTEIDLESLHCLLIASRSHELKSIKTLINQTFGTGGIFQAQNSEPILNVIFKEAYIKEEDIHPAVFDFADGFSRKPAAFRQFWESFNRMAAAETPLKARLLFEVAFHLLSKTSEPVDPSMVLTGPFIVFTLGRIVDTKGLSDGIQALHRSAMKVLRQINNTIAKMTDQKALSSLANNVLEINKANEVKKNKAWTHLLTNVLRRLDSENMKKIIKNLTDLLDSKTESGPNAEKIVHLLEQICFDRVKNAEDVDVYAGVVRMFTKKAFGGSDSADAAVEASRKDLYRFVSTSTMESGGKQKQALWSSADMEKCSDVKLAVLKTVMDADVKLTAEQETIRKDVLATISKVENAKNLQAPVRNAFLLLLNLIGSLWLHSHTILCREILDDLKALVDGLKKAGKKESGSGNVMEKFITILSSLFGMEKSHFTMVELVFRCVCPVIDEKSLGVLLDFIAPEEMADGDQIEVDSESDESEHDSGSEDEESGEVEPEIDRAALKEVPGVADEDAAESEPDLDDDTMFKLDQAMAGILRARKAEKNKSGEDADVRLRAMRLLQIFYAFREADNGLLLSIVLPIMRFASEKPLQHVERQKHAMLVSSAGRLLGTMKHHRKIDADTLSKQISKEDLVELLKEAVTDAGKLHDMKLFEQFIEGVLFVERALASVASQEDSDASVLHSCLKDAIENFASKRGSAFAHVLLERMLSSANSVSWKLLPDVFKVIFTEGESGEGKKHLTIRRVQMCNVAQSVLRSLPKEVNMEEMQTLIRSFGKDYLAMLKKMVTKEEDNAKKLVEQSTKLARDIVGWVKRHRKSDESFPAISKLWDLTEADEVLTSLISNLDAAENRGTRRMFTSFQLSLNEEKKRANPEVTEGSPAVERPAKKQKKNQE